MAKSLVRRTRLSRLAFGSLVLAVIASAVLALAPTGLEQSAVQVVGPGRPAPTTTEATVSRTSLIDHEGPSVLIPLGIPVAICLLAIAATFLSCSATPFGVASVVLLVFCVFGAASIGLFYVPSAALMALAAGTSFSPGSGR